MISPILRSRISRERDGPSSAIAQVNEALQATEDEEASVDENGNEDSSSDLGPVGRVILAADELVVVAPEQQAEDGQDDDGEQGDDDA